MQPATYHGSQIGLELRKLDGAKGWIGQCTIVDAEGLQTIQKPTTSYATKQMAGQAAFNAACKHIDREVREALWLNARRRRTA
jgi:hypothetical protein